MKNLITKIDFNAFPAKLKKIKDPPKQLYIIGNESLLYEECFAIVGTRKISKYGIQNCKNFSKEFALRKIPIISGMALGTDTVAHETCIKYGEKTIAVLGSGLNKIFPIQNKELFNKIIELDGLIISEYNIDEEPAKEHFPKRNRIITALAEGILVIEAAYRSGTSITARLAKEQGKNVFAIPGKLNTTVGVGVNRFIKEGAILTTSIEDILNMYPNFKSREITQIVKKRIKPEYKLIYQFIEDGKFLDEILEKTKENIPKIIYILSQMEDEELIYQDIDGMYKKIE